MVFECLSVECSGGWEDGRLGLRPFDDGWHPGVSMRSCVRVRRDLCHQIQVKRAAKWIHKKDDDEVYESVDVTDVTTTQAVSDDLLALFGKIDELRNIMIWLNKQGNR